MNRLDQKYVFGGIDQQIDDVLQDKNKTKDQANSRILPTYSVLSKRKGVRKYNSQVIWGGKYLRGMFEYFSGSTRRIFALVGTDIFYDNNDGVFVKAGLTLTDTSNHLLSGVSYKGRAYMANNHDAMITYNGTTFGNAGLPVPVLGDLSAIETIGTLPLGTYGYKITYIYDGYQETDASVAYSKTTGDDFLENNCESTNNWQDNGLGAVTLSIIEAPVPDNSRSHDFMRATFANGGVYTAIRGFQNIDLTHRTTANFNVLHFYVRSSVNLSNLTVGLYDGATLREEWVIGPPTYSNLVAGVWTLVQLPMTTSQSTTVSILKFTTEFGDDPATFTLDISDIYYDYPACDILLSDIPISSDPRVTARKIYRTILGGSVYYLLTTIANNTTPTYVDRIIDDDLGTEVPPISISNGLTYIKDVVLLQDRLFAISTLQGATSTILVSTEGYPDNFPAAFDPDDSAGGGPLEIAKDDGDELMRLFGMEDWLYCFKKNYIYKVYVKGDPLTSWEIRILHNVGSTSYFGVVKGENDFYFYHTTGIYHIVDYSIEKISEPIRDYIKNIPTSMVGNPAMGLDRTRKKLLFAFCDPYISPTTVNNSLAVFDLVTKEWESVDSGLYIKSFLEKDDGIMLYGDYIDGFVKKLNQYEDDQNQEKIIANIDNETTWTGGAADAVNYKDGLKGLKITATSNQSATGITVFTNPVSLDSWDNGDISDADDFIDFWLYHTVRDDIVSITLDIDVNDGAYTDKYTYAVGVADLTSGNNAWTKIHIKKSAFTRTGATVGKDWSSVKGLTFTVAPTTTGTAVVTIDDIRMIADQRKAVATHYKTKAISPVSSETDHHFVDLYLECRKFVDSDLTIKYDIEHGKKTKELTLWSAKNFNIGITDNDNTRIVVRRKNDLVYLDKYDGDESFKPRAICGDDTYYYALIRIDLVASMINKLAIIRKSDLTANIILFDAATVTAVEGICCDDTYLYVTDYDGARVNIYEKAGLFTQATDILLFATFGSFGMGPGAALDVDLALHKPSACSSAQGGEGSDGAFDGGGYNGISGYAWAGWQYPTAEWVSVDLETAQEVGRVVLHWLHWSAAGVKYLIQYSSDNTNWTTAYSETDGQALIQHIIDLAATPITARYWRFYGTELAPGETEWRIMEFVINGYDPNTEDSRFRGPTGICCDDTYLYIVDMGNNRVKKHLKASPYSYVAEYGRAGSGVSRSYGVGNYELKTPFGICCDFEHLWITDAGNSRIMKIRKDMADDCFVAKIGYYGTTGNDCFNVPRGIVVDDNYIYVVDGGNDNLHKREKELLKFVEMYGSSGSGNDQLNEPYDVAINDLDYIVPDRIHTKVAIERVGKCISLNFKQEEVGQNMEIMAIDLSYRATKLRGK